VLKNYVLKIIPRQIRYQNLNNNLGQSVGQNARNILGPNVI